MTNRMRGDESQMMGMAVASAGLKKSKSFIRCGSKACWIHTITLKYKYKLDNKT